MRANITYSVGVDNIIEELIDIVNNIGSPRGTRLVDWLEEINGSLGQHYYLEARQNIMKTRQKLGDADIRLHEVDQILASYIDMINREGQNEEEVEEQDETG